VNAYEAIAICTGSGGRLPTAWEISRKDTSTMLQAKISDCPGKTQAFFTGTRCSNGGYVVKFFNKKGQQQSTCIDPTTSAGPTQVVCVAKMDKEECMSCRKHASSPAGSKDCTCDEGYQLFKDGFCKRVQG